MPVTDVNSYLQFLLLYKMVLHGGSDVIFHSLVIKKVAHILIRILTHKKGKGSKIKLIIFAEFSAKGFPPFAENN